MSLPLSALIPLLLVFSALLGDFVFYKQEMDALHIEIHEESVATVKHDANRLQNILYTNVTQGDINNAKLYLSVTAMDKEINKILLVDDNDMILLSSHYLDENKRVDRYKKYNKVIAKKVVRTKKHLILTNENENEHVLYGYFPAKLPVDNNKTKSFDRLGVLFVEYSMDNKIKKASLFATNKSIRYGAVILLLAIVIAVLLHQLITVKLKKLTNVTEKISSGDLSSRVDLSGVSEIRSLANSFNIMTGNLSQLISQRDIDAENLKLVNKELLDKTEQTAKALNEKSEHERIMRMALKGAGSGIFIYDFGTGKLFWDEKSLEMFGLKKSDFSSSFDDWVSHVYPADLDQALSKFQTEIDNKSIYHTSLEYRVNHPEKGIRFIRAMIQIERDKSGSALKVYGLHFDDTDLKNKQKQLNDAKELAESANKAKSTFLANMSHELRTPMHGILSFANFGITKSNDIDNEKIPFYFHQIEDSGKRLMTLLNDLLDLAKLEAGKFEMDFNNESIVDVCKTVIQEQQLRLNDKNMDVVWDLQQDDFYIDLDKKMMNQVFTNLISNAIKFNKEGKPIVISMMNKKLESGLDGFYFSMRDHGIGIPDGEFTLIFSRFEQSSHTIDGSGGTGLGLPICDEIIEAHQGRIWAENHADGGAVFCFHIPLLHADMQI